MPGEDATTELHALSLVMVTYKVRPPKEVSMNV